MNNLFSFLANEIAAFLIGLVLGAFFTWAWRKAQEMRHQGWCVVLKYQKEAILTRRVSAGKIIEIFEEPAELAVFVKGVISPYARIGCDPLETDGFIKYNHDQKEITIDLDVDFQLTPNALLTNKQKQHNIL